MTKALRNAISDYLNGIDEGYTIIDDTIYVEKYRKHYKIKGHVHKVDYIDYREEHGTTGETDSDIEITAQEWTEDSKLVGEIYEY